MFLLIAGCATQQPSPYRWEKAGATRDDYVRESSQCEERALGITSNDRERVMSVWAACLSGKGWRLVDR